MKGVIRVNITGKGAVAPQLTLLGLDSTAITEAGTHSINVKAVAVLQLIALVKDVTRNYNTPVTEGGTSRSCTCSASSRTCTCPQSMRSCTYLLADFKVKRLCCSPMLPPWMSMPSNNSAPAMS